MTTTNSIKITQEFKKHVDEAQNEQQYYYSMKKGEENVASTSDNPPPYIVIIPLILLKSLTMLVRLDRSRSNFL